MTWQLKEKLQKTLAEEQGAMVFPPGSRQGFALVYPNTYHVGMSNLGFQIIYQQVNSRGDTACERLFLPDRKTEPEYIRTNTPLMTIETQRPLYGFSLIGFALTFEMDYFNVVNILQLGKVPVLAADRGEKDPLVIAGGPCATFNPEPLADLFDVFIIGEGEEIIHEILDVYYQARDNNISRQEILFQIAQIPGAYVPCFYQVEYKADGTIKKMSCPEGVPQHVQRRWIQELDQYEAQTVIVTPNTEFKDMFLIEVARGCGRHCRFCMAGYCYRNPRVRSLKTLEAAVVKAKEYRSKVGLMGAAISDYPEIDSLCNIILEQGMHMSVASLRADTLTLDLVNALAVSKHRTITLAPEAASIRLRKVINKTITDEHLFNSIKMAVNAGIPHIRLYIMIGLPSEEEEDIEEIVTMAINIKEYMESLGSRGRLTLSVNPFIPKPFTPFQWMPMTQVSVVEKRLKYINSSLRQRRGIEVLVESPKEAYIQGVLARGDRRLSAVLLDAHEKGGSKGFKQAMKENMLREEDYLYRQREPESEILPWKVLDMGLDSLYLERELEEAKKEEFTAPCAQGCTRCGICKKG
ncbi:TIGR03960 family B12-binding radical SAM protein [Pelosinus baikalensis]|uniref:TIGR03960 family B12-binding radical SAM protein n=1 Tax=Pelosinus baikalensis TaxID=2892015 RepID=A0ABS8HP93_9FIRM|nr:TIGR03960 family B12-binding radical SAM protein [Pelosinus baikalensis]MCC5465030.1 TIGR03960 family B12-binding radical SAM protein [Pelosinus baikalensis]